MTTSERYTTVAIALHWTIAIGLVVMVLVGWYMSDLPNTASNKFVLYQLHKSFGIAILTLTGARIAWRILNPPPPLPIGLSVWERRLSQGVHIGFYGLMLALPLSGWMMVSASPSGIPTKIFGLIDWPHLPILSTLAIETKRTVASILHTIHGRMGWLVFGLLALHVAGALKHDFIDKDGAVLSRMLPGLFGRAKPPSRKPNGVLTAFGGAAALFVAVAAAPILFTGNSSVSAQAPSQQVSNLDPNWTIVAEDSQIYVVGILSGYDVPAYFEDWTAQIEFYEDNLPGSAANVVLQSGSVTANDAYLDGTVGEEDWLGVDQHPVISVAVTNIRADGEGYLADLSYDLKGNTYEAQLPFDLRIADDRATMSATLTVDRFDIGIGANADPDKEWIDSPLEVVIEVVATRSS